MQVVLSNFLGVLALDKKAESFLGVEFVDYTTTAHSSNTFLNVHLALFVRWMTTKTSKDE